MVDCIASYPQLVWERLAKVVGEGTCFKELRHKCLYATLRGGAFLHMDCFECLRMMPYALTQGVIEANVQKIADTSADDQHVEMNLKIKRGIDLGMPSETYVELVQHWRKASCTSHITEQGHALGAKLHRYRKELYFETMRDRTTAMSLAVYVLPSPVEKQLERLGDRLDRLARENPRMCRAFGALFKRVLEQKA